MDSGFRAHSAGIHDLAVVGAGSAGFSAAITAANEGARVALIGHGTIGGTCVNVGCVPSKTMIRAAEGLHGARAVGRFAGLAGDARIKNWVALTDAKDDLVATLRQSKYDDLLSEYRGIDYIEGKARFEGNALTVAGAPLPADRIVIATGAAPALPDIPGIDTVSVLTSTTALDLAERPESLLVIGGGYVGCELAQMFARMGTRVALITRSRLLPEAAPEISEALARYLREEGVRVLTDTSCDRIARDDMGIALTVVTRGRPEVLSAAQVMAATGRSPNTASLRLDKAGIGTDARGAVTVDARMRTTRADVWAAGDVTGRDQFVYMAAYGAKLAARNALGARETEIYDNAIMPWVVFTDPQVASVGLTEKRAVAAGHSVKTSVLPLDQVPRALVARDQRGLIKLVADRRTDQLLGGQILAPEGGDSIQTLAMALTMLMTAKALGETIFPHLTNVEGLKLAAQTFEMDVAMLSCCAG